MPEFRFPTSWRGWVIILLAGFAALVAGTIAFGLATRVLKSVLGASL